MNCLYRIEKEGELPGDDFNKYLGKNSDTQRVTTNLLV